MKKSKAILVTALVAAMLAVIYCGLFLLNKTGFFILTGILTAYGFTHGAFDFRRWLSADEPLQPAAPAHTGKLAERPKHSGNRKPVFDIMLDEPTGTETRR